jgi:hypothetical protein
MDFALTSSRLAGAGCFMVTGAPGMELVMSAVFCMMMRALEELGEGALSNGKRLDLNGARKTESMKKDPLNDRNYMSETAQHVGVGCVGVHGMHHRRHAFFCYFQPMLPSMTETAQLVSPGAGPASTTGPPRLLLQPEELSAMIARAEARQKEASERIQSSYKRKVDQPGTAAVGKRHVAAERLSEMPQEEEGSMHCAGVPVTPPTSPATHPSTPVSHDSQRVRLESVRWNPAEKVHVPLLPSHAAGI